MEHDKMVEWLLSTAHNPTTSKRLLNLEAKKKKQQIRVRGLVGLQSTNEP
jgi:hypothetical protein